MNFAERFKNATLIDIVAPIGIAVGVTVGFLALFGVFPG